MRLCETFMEKSCRISLVTKKDGFDLGLDNAVRAAAAAAKVQGPEISHCIFGTMLCLQTNGHNIIVIQVLQPKMLTFVRVTPWPLSRWIRKMLTPSCTSIARSLESFPRQKSIWWASTPTRFSARTQRVRDLVFFRKDCGEKVDVFLLPSSCRLSAASDSATPLWL